MVRDLGIAICVAAVSVCGLVLEKFAASIAARKR